MLVAGYYWIVNSASRCFQMHWVIWIFLYCDFLVAGGEAQCRSSEIKCKTTTACIPWRYVCDFINDCPEGVDENNCVFQESGCGSPVYQTGTNGSFTSMHYPQSYNDNAFCKWLIEVPNGQIVKLQFDSFFDLEKPRGGKCLLDGVAVYQYEPSVILKGSYCDKGAPPEMTINSSKVLVQFHTNEHTVGKGFKITWKAVSPPPVYVRTLRDDQLVKRRGQRGSIMSPPLLDVNARSPGINLRWQIEVDPGYFVLLSFSSFFMGNSWEDARVEIYDGQNSTGKLLVSTFGNNPPKDVTSSSNYLYVSMIINDESRSNKWFNASFSQTLTKIAPSQCDGVAATVTSSTGWISSPNFDGRTPYRKNLHCQWNFEAPDDMQYEFSFTFFMLERSSNCTKDYLQITQHETENDIATEKEIKRLCDFYLPFDIRPSSSKVTFNFHTDYTSQYAGFNVTYVMIKKQKFCGDSMFLCRSGTCVMKSVVCDGKSDCSDGSDEYVCPHTSSCGSTPIRPKLISAKIFGGQVANSGSWPWAVSILKPSKDHICGGILIDLQWVITAAHCFSEAISRTYAGYSVVAGRFQKQVPDRNEQHRSFDKVFVPTNFDPSKGTFEHDIALVRLSSPFQKTDYVRPVCMPKGPVTSGTYGWIVGWGETQNDKTYKGKLKQASVPVIAQSICRQSDYYSDLIYEHMMCAGYPNGGTDTCSGDSGGPFVIRRGASGPWEVQGVTSAGTACGRSKKPGIYTKVWDYRSWIQQTIAAYY